MRIWGYTATDAWFIWWSFHEPTHYVDRLNWFRRRSQLQPKYIQKNENAAHFGQTACKIRYNNLFSSSESTPFQSRFKGEISGRTRREERLSRSKLKEAFLIDSDAELSMNKVRLMKISASLTRSYSSSHYLSCEKGKKGCFIKKICREKENCLKLMYPV